MTNIMSAEIFKLSGAAFCLVPPIDVFLFEAPAESWTTICFHIVTEKGVWGKYLEKGKKFRSVAEWGLAEPNLF